MKWFGAAIFMVVVLSFGSLWGLGYLAFGQARCAGINPFAMTALAVIVVITIYALFSGLDWINDWLAARAVSKAQLQTNKTLTEQARTLGQQLLVQKRMALPPEPSGGLDYSEGVFEDYSG